MVKLSKRAIAYIFLLINVITWGAALPIVKLGLGPTTPFRFLTYRYVLAVFLTLPILAYYWSRLKHKSHLIGTIIGLELLGTTAGLSLLYVGLDKTTSLEASLIATTTPIFITLGGIWFLKEKEERHEWIGLALAFVGTLLMTFLPGVLRGDPFFGGSFFGNFLVFGNNVITAVYFILAKNHLRKIPKLFATTISFYVGLVTFGILSIIEMHGDLFALYRIIRIDLTYPSVWFISLYMATFGSIIGLTAYIKGQDEIEASEASLFGYLQPLVYIPLSYLLFKEGVSPLQIASLGLVLAGIIIAEKRFRKRKA